MLAFAWNALRAGDRVFLHDGASAASTLFPGVVTSVSMRTGKGYNGVGIRVAATGGLHDIVWPSPFVVHSDGPNERCWRCLAA